MYTAGGVNGRLPNLDLVNAAAHIVRWVGGIPVRLHNQSHGDAQASSAGNELWSRYAQRAGGMLRQAQYAVSTTPNGPEGLFGM